MKFGFATLIVEFILLSTLLGLNIVPARRKIWDDPPAKQRYEMLEDYGCPFIYLRISTMNYVTKYEIWDWYFIDLSEDILLGIGIVLVVFWACERRYLKTENRGESGTVRTDTEQK